MKRSQNVRVSELNPHLMCALCGGYYVDATTIIECLHSFCKTCIVRYLDSSKFCPICDVQVHKTKPLLNIRPDHTLQELVYKLVPGLFTREVLKRREFYRKNPGSLSSSGSEAGYSPDGANDPLNTRGHVVPDDTMSISLEFSVDGKVVESRTSKAKGRNSMKDSPILQKRYLLCPASFTIGHMKKFIRWKFDLSPMLEIDVFHVDEPLSDSYALLDITHIYNWTKNEPFPLYFSVFENAAKRQKCDEQITNLPKESTSEAIVEESSTSNTKQTKRKSSTNDADDADADVDVDTPTAATKSVKRKLDDELEAVDDKSQVASGDPPEGATVTGEEMYDGPTENEEEEAEEEEEFYSELPDGQSNGCKISTSSSGKSIVVSIPKHLLENSGSDKEKKKKKSKRRDNHRHHRHHRKHKHQSRDESEADGDKDSVKSKKRKQSRDGSVTAQDNSSSVSNSPPTDVNNDVSSDGTTPDSGAASNEVRSKDNSNGSNDVISEDATKSGNRDPEETSQQSYSKTESNTDESTRKQTDKTSSPQDCQTNESGRTANTEIPGQNRSRDLSATNQRDSGSVTNEKIPNAAQREPVLHQLQEEWKRHLAADEQSRTKTETETTAKTDGRKSPSGQLTTSAGAHPADEKRVKANAKQTRDSPQQKKAQIQRLQLKKASLKHKQDSPNKVQAAKQKLQSVTETLQKLKRVKENQQQQATNKPAKDHVTDVSTEQKTRNHEKSASQNAEDASRKNGEKQQTESKEKHENKKQNEETSEKVTGDASTGECSLKKQRTAESRPEVNTTQAPKQGCQKGDTPTTKSIEVSKCNTSTSSSLPSSSSSSSSPRFVESTSSVSSGIQKTRGGSSQPSLDTIQKDKRTSELKDPKSEKSERADRCADSLSGVQSTASGCQRKSDALPAAKDSPTTTAAAALRRGHVTGRPTGPAVRPGRPDTLNVPMPWRSLSSLAKAGRKVQESANNALGRNSPCGSSARMLTQARTDDKRTSNGCSPSTSRLALDRRDTSSSKCFSPFPDSLTPFESPTMPKGIKTYSKKDKLLYKNQSLYGQSSFAYDSSFKTILGNPDDDVVAHRNPASGSTPSALLGSSSLLTVSRKDRTQASGIQRQIHGHKVIGQLNMVYETIQKPSYSEVCRKSPKQASPSKPPTPTFGAKVNGEQKADPELNSGSGSDNREQVGSDFEQISSDKNSVEQTDGGQPTKDKADVNSGDAMTSSSTSKEQRTNVTFTRTSHTKAEPSRVGDGQSEADRKSMAAPEVGKKCLEYGRCEASFSASSSHLPTSPPRYSHKCGASSPSEAICLKCSPRPRSTSPHVTSGLQRPFAVPCPRERSQSASLGCPRAAHTACATGAHSPQNNNMGAAASLTSLDLPPTCDQCQSAPVGTSTETHNNFDKMALQEVPLDLHKPRSRPDQ